MKRVISFLCIFLFLPFISYVNFKVLTPEYLFAQETAIPLEQEVTPDVGDLELRSTPPGAFVYIDGDDEGTSDILITDVPAGEHKITFQVGDKELSDMFLVHKNERLKLRADFESGKILNITSEVKKILDEVSDRIIKLIKKSGCSCLGDYYNYDYMDSFNSILAEWSNHKKIAGKNDCEQFRSDQDKRIRCVIKVKFFYFDTNSKMTCSISRVEFDANNIKADSKRYLSPLYSIPEGIRKELYILE